MIRRQVESSVLKSVGYDQKKKVLEAELVNNTIYAYYKVPQKEYENFISATSLGEYYNRHIKKYPYEKLR